ncbi:hypothetical protein RMATCC62417_14370 [Rhizopus microsporus]|nr:hypothetical protein RMATCC62417_14370 [Rhizopus microsporus]
MRFVMEPLRMQGIRIVCYLEDICLLARTKEAMYKNAQATLAHLSKLGFIINYSKSKLIPEKVQDGQAIVEVTNEKVMSLVSKFNWENYCNDVSDGRCAPTCTLPSKGPSQQPTPTTTELGSSMSPAFRLAARARMVADDEFKTKLVLPICTDNSKLEELLKPNFTIYVNASDSGWEISSE